MITTLVLAGSAVLLVVLILALRLGTTATAACAFVLGLAGIAAAVATHMLWLFVASTLTLINAAITLIAAGIYRTRGPRPPQKQAPGWPPKGAPPWPPWPPKGPS
ncbi:hypothetical protein ABZ468_53315 [Streptomyces sp. NPDC005708]|uniref:hypothetical protein n=1 Tax=Streptomyces sp. NPDC005708 TaxID=3154564 RepID=UPI0033E9B4C8